MEITFYKKIISKIKTITKIILPKPLLKLLKYFYRNFNQFRGLLYGFIFFISKDRYLSLKQRLSLIKKIYLITKNVSCPHTESQMLSFISAVFSISSNKKGCIVEAGSYKGGSTAKFSIAAKLTNRKLLVFDSFKGLPNNKEAHDRNIFGHSIKGQFVGGAFYGTLSEVEETVKKYGELEVCTFIKGWFENTMPNFSEPIAAIYLDVDLASSTRTCLKYLYPLLIPGGVLYSQDGNFPLVIEVFNDNKFWKQEVGCTKPLIKGLGQKKLIKIEKPDNFV